MTRITEYVSDMAEKAKQAFLHEDKSAMKQVDQLEDIVDILQDRVTGYLSSLCKTGSLTQNQSARVSGMIRAVSDIERVGDQYMSITNFAKLKSEKEYTFTEQAVKELQEGFEHVRNMLELTVKALHDADTQIRSSRCSSAGKCGRFGTPSEQKAHGTTESWLLLAGKYRGIY